MSRDLFEGVEKRSGKAIKTAIEAGAKLDATNDDGYTALHLLCKSKSGVMSKNEVIAAIWLLEQGASVTCTSKRLETPLHFAVRSGSREMIEALIARGATITRDRWGNTPLHRCLSTNEKDTWIWDRMLQLGCALEDCNDAGETPLLVAQMNWNVRAVTYFLAKGAARDARDSSGKTVLERALALKQDKIVKALS